MEVIAGAPNIVRGGSHSGNVARRLCCENGAVDAFASDYVPPAWSRRRSSARNGIGLPEAVALITDAGATGRAARSRPAGTGSARRSGPGAPARDVAGGAAGLARRRTGDLMGPDARVAIYYAPQADDPLSRGGLAWLGRDPASDAPVPQPDVAEYRRGHRRAAALRVSCDAEAADASGEWVRVGRCGGGCDDTGERIAPFELPPLAVPDLYGFLALRETAPAPRCRRWPMRASNTSMHFVRRRPRPNWRGGGAPI